MHLISESLPTWKHDEEPRERQDGHRSLVQAMEKSDALKIGLDDGVDETDAEKDAKNQAQEAGSGFPENG